MKTRTWMTLAGVVLAIGVAIAVASPLLAQGRGAGYGPGMYRGQMMDGMPGPGYAMGMRGGMGPMQGMRGRMGGGQQSLVGVAADTLGMTQADLLAQIQGGKTIAQIAAERTVALSTIVDAFVATRQARMATAVADGRMTQAQVDAMLATMRANVTEQLSQPWPAHGPGVADQDGDGVCDYAGSGRMPGGPMSKRGNQ